MSLTSARATLYSILLMIATAAAAVAQVPETKDPAAALQHGLLDIGQAVNSATSPEPINPHTMLKQETYDPASQPSQGAWTLILNVYGYKYGGPTRMPNLSQRVCAALMEKMNAKDVRSIRRATGDEDGIRGANAIACINTHTAEVIWP